MTDSGTPTRFLGVRLELEEAHALDRIMRARQLTSRSDVIRALLRESDPEAPRDRRPRRELTEEMLDLLPLNARTSLEDMVEDGWCSDLHQALDRAVDRGVTELHMDYGERRERARSAARSLAERRTRRRRASEGGDRLLRP